MTEPAGSAGTPRQPEHERTITREDLKTMSPHAIVAAKNEGRLDHLLKGQN